MAGGNNKARELNDDDDARDSTSTPTKDEGESEVAIKVNNVPTNLKNNQPPPVNRRSLPPFIASHDLPRGAIFMLQSTLGYALMLAVM